MDLAVYPGEIHALLGENGAAKSTLMNIRTAVYQPNEGGIVPDGETRRLASPHDAIAAGIGMVHRHFKPVEAFTVAENVHLGRDTAPERISARALQARTADLARAQPCRRSGGGGRPFQRRTAEGAHPARSQLEGARPDPR